jgi:Phasin protein
MSEFGKTERAEQFLRLTWPMDQVNLDSARQFWERSETFAKALADWNTEITHFVTKRISRSGEAVSRVTQCRSLPEVFEVEAQWLRGTFDDYSGEARRLMEVNSRIISSFVEPTGPVGTPASSTKGPHVEPTGPVGAPASSTKVPQRERTDAGN